MATSDTIVVYPERGVVARFFAWAFAPVRLSPEAHARLEHASQTGRLLFVLKTSSFLSTLLLASVLRASKLPALGYVSHLNFIWWQRLGWVFRSLFGRVEGPSVGTLLNRQHDDRGEAAWIEDTFARGQSALLFLFRPRTATSAGRVVIGGRALQRVLRSGAPLQLVPLSFFYEQHRETFRRSLIDFMFGPRSGPGRLRELVLFLLHRNETVVSVGEITTIVPGTNEEEIRLRALRSLQEQARIVRGPRQRERAHIIAAVLRDPDLRLAVTTEAVNKKCTETEAAVVARRYLKEIAADYKDHYITFFRYVLDWVFNRIYDGVIVDEVGLERVREAEKTSTIVLTPCHKSHADYLILSYLFRLRGMQVPHIVAGINLSFWPLGRAFRGAGAFFIRRSFKNNPLYGAAFKAYVKRLVHDGTTIEFFPEGGRSRTGRLLLPKLGMFKYVTEAWRAPGAPDLTLVPVSIDYEKIIEQAAYQEELLGGKKKREDISGALLSTRKVLQSRYGRVHVSFGAPIRLSQFARARNVHASAGPRCSDEEATTLGRALGYHVMAEIGRVSTVTPQALAACVLLNARAGTTSKRQLFERAARWMSELRWLGAPLSHSLQLPERALDEAVQRFAEQKAVRVEHVSADGNALLSVPSEQRLTLSYFQNQLTSHVVAHAIVSVAALALGAVTINELQAASLDLSKMLKYEFSFRSDRPFASLFGLVLTELVAEGFLALDAPGTTGNALDDIVRPARSEGLVELASTLDATIGAYVATIDALDELHQFPLWERELQTRAVDRVRAWLLEGRVRTSESVQKILVQGAIAWLLDLEVLTSHVEAGKAHDPTSLTLSGRFSSAEALAMLRDHYGRFLFSYAPKGPSGRTTPSSPSIIEQGTRVPRGAPNDQHRHRRLG